MNIDPVLIRSLSLFVPITTVWLAFMWREPETRHITGIMLACVWTIPTLFLLNIVAIRFNWWQFEAQGGLFAGIPLDLFLGWVLLWGAIPALLFPRVKLFVMLAIMLLFDIVMMPLMEPIIQLGPRWLAGEFLGILFCLLPAQLLARWVTADDHLYGRVGLLVIAFSGLMLGILPTIILELTGGTWQVLFERSFWLNSLYAQLLAIPAIIGLSAVQEFAQCGQGTPIPFDPPKKLVTSGVYAYVANPMQLSSSLMLAGWGLLLNNIWIVFAGVVAFVYSAGFAAWSEAGDLDARFGARWLSYRQGVRFWRPRWRPWYVANNDETLPARLYVAGSCAICSEIGQWLISRQPVGLSLVAAEMHPTHNLIRLTYEHRNLCKPEEGVVAFARALEHIHLGWAILGWTIRLPIIRTFLQLIVDAVGGGPRRIPRSAPAQIKPFQELKQFQENKSSKR